MKKKTIITWIIIAVIFINLPLWDAFIGRDYTYTNVDGSYHFAEMTGKGGSYDQILLNYGGFLALHPEKDKGDNNLYRTFTVQPWRFWEWRQMIFHIDRFRLPYKEP